MTETYIVGDIHGHYSRLVALLLNAGLIARDLTWTGRDATLCFVGDYVDRGPDGIKVIDYLISLQIQAELRGGRVIALLGNHDALMMAAHRFGDWNTPGSDSFLSFWSALGGQKSDIDGLTPEHIAWLTHLPGMVKIADSLIVHADARLYLNLGDTIDAVNAAFETALRSYDRARWSAFIRGFNEHRGFFGEARKIAALSMLESFGADQIVHGHTPIPGMVGAPPETVREPLIYHDGLCVGVDGGIYQGGPGFVWRLQKTNR